MKHVEITRTDFHAKCTIGTLKVIQDGTTIFTCRTLELPWLDNKQNISCIPTGEYNLIRRKSQRYNDHYHIDGVPGRDAILIHTGNSYKHTRGCVLIGTSIKDINADTVPDVIQSRYALYRLLWFVTEPKCKIIIK